MNHFQLRTDNFLFFYQQIIEFHFDCTLQNAIVQYSSNPKTSEFSLGAYHGWLSHVNEITFERSKNKDYHVNAISYAVFGR